MSVLNDVDRRRADESPDCLFYRNTRLVYHADHDCLAQLQELYFRMIPQGGAVLDLCSSWVSHLPRELSLSHVEGQGMNVRELRCNPLLDAYFVQDLNLEPRLPLPDGKFDAVLMCCGIQYLTQPEAVLAEARRVLAPGGALAVSFTRNCFEVKATRGWARRTSAQRVELVQALARAAGFADVCSTELSAANARPMWVVHARRPAAAAVAAAAAAAAADGQAAGAAADGSSPAAAAAAGASGATLAPPPLSAAAAAAAAVTADATGNAAQASGGLTEAFAQSVGPAVAAAARRDAWAARCAELLAAAEDLGIPAYGLPAVAAGAPERDLREAMADVSLIVASYQCADI
ncbi:hypothetical protein JKP88DRAFT_199508 [Tribonema minus]|uniref:Methyltransferase type 11 domain-containing protein n=1 Tax=Tribonema minus TaxID=303371 RepID=A0A835YWL9_9STRA|nr:hypothetical protein JKP88DRAFT_199508 [Tribonema minus]